MDLPVPLPLYIASQFFALCVLVSVFLAYQLKDKNKIMLAFIGVNTLALFSALFLTDWIAAALLIVSQIRSITFYFLNKYRNKISKPIDVSTLILFEIIAVIAVWLTWTKWLDFVLLAVTMSLFFGMWSKNPHHQRILNIPYSIVYIIHFFLVKNFMFIAVETTVIISITIFYIKFFKSRKAKPETIDG